MKYDFVCVFWGVPNKYIILFMLYSIHIGCMAHSMGTETNQGMTQWIQELVAFSLQTAYLVAPDTHLRCVPLGVSQLVSVALQKVPSHHPSLFPCWCDEGCKHEELLSCLLVVFSHPAISRMTNNAFSLGAFLSGSRNNNQRIPKFEV